MKLSKKAWRNIGKVAGWLKVAQVNTVETTLYLDENGIYRYQRVNGMNDDEGIDVVIEYEHNKAQPETYIDPGISAYNEVISVKRLNDGVEIFNYDEEDLADSELLSDDVQNIGDSYWEHKDEQYREEEALRREDGF